MKHIPFLMATALTTRRGIRRWVPAIMALVALLALSGGQYATSDAAQNPTMEPFAATGLPAGPATGVPVRRTFPAGFTLKHVHGGPTYVYVIAGSLDIADSDGHTVTYTAGDFFWESPGYIHTVVVPESAEVFILQFLPPGAGATIPVQ